MTTSCPECGTELAPSLLACPVCGRLVHADQLKRLTADADQETTSGNLVAALTALRAAVELLPPGTRQHDVISTRIADLSRQVDAGAATPAESAKPAWAKKSGILGAIGLAAWKLKFLVVFLITKAKFLLLGLTKGGTFFSMLLSLSVYWRAFGWRFAFGIIGSIYIHEMGHIAMLRRFGIPSTAPMFIPGFGALIRSRHYPKDVVAQARVGLAGPIWGLGAALACYGIYLWTNLPAWGALAHVGAWINLFNLLPVWQLDGAHGFRSMTKRQRWMAVATIGAMYFLTADGLLLLVLLGGVWAAWRFEPVERPDWRALAEYAALIIVLAAMTKIPVSLDALFVATAQ